MKSLKYGINIISHICGFPARERIKRNYCGFLKRHELSGYDFREGVKKYVSEMKAGTARYLFSKSCNVPTIYSNVYGFLISEMYSLNDNEERKAFGEYLDRHQRGDGLFFDGCYDSRCFFCGTGGWGAQHLVPHITVACDRIRKIPRHEFKYLLPYMNKDYLIKWLDSLDYRNIWASSNHIMNIGVAMQFARDRMGMPFAEAVYAMEDYLVKKINKKYGMWYEGEVHNQAQRNEMVRGAYHILPLLYYDKWDIPYADTALEQVLAAQNRWGGFDADIGSSACQDIDGVDQLIRYSMITGIRDERIISRVRKAKKWILFNQNEDGGFVFQRSREFKYGGQSTLASRADESNLFAAWFRSLSLEIIDSFLKNRNSVLIHTPGYECPLRHEIP